jgi:hypothetical protein
VRILLLDIETAPNMGYFWGLWEQNISTDKIVDSSYILCWSAKWLGDKEVMYDSVHQSSEKKMLKGVHKLLDEADVVVHYNGRSFDIPVLNREFLLNKMPPPAPFKQVDLLKVSRSSFRFQSHKLDYVMKMLGHGGKIKHEGFQLWVKCMNGDDDAWEKMEAYNKGDVTGLEKVYYDFRPWIKGHPNHGAFDDHDGCPHCASGKLQRRGLAVTRDQRYQRYQCLGCGAWSRSKKAEGKASTTVVGITNG